MMSSIELGVPPSETSILIPERRTDTTESQRDPRPGRWGLWLIVAGLVVVALSTLSLNGLASSSKTYVLSGSSTDLQNGAGFFEGDLLNIPPNEVEKAYGPKVAQEYARKFGLVWKPRVKGDDLIADESSLWPGGVFYYTYSPTLTATSKNRFIEAMQHVSQKVPRVTFVERTTQSAYTTIMTPLIQKGCFSTDIGRRGNNLQAIGVSNFCSTGNSVHEIMHAMGFWHEQSRPDRDTWVNILNQNIEAGKERNFEKREAWETNSRGSPYDYGSIMHYPKRAFSIDRWNLDTITKRVDKGPTLGQRNAMSPEDEFQMNAAYPRCDGRTNLALRRTTFQSSTSWEGMSSRGVDGNTNNNYDSGSCTHTGNEDHPWWTVDLGSTKDVCSVVLTNRGDCCSNRLVNFDIFVTDTRPSTGFRPSGADLCVRVKNTFSGTKSFSCEGIKRGRYVGVQIREQQILTLCEVQIFGPPPTCNSSTLALNKAAFQSSTSWNGVASRGVDGNSHNQYYTSNSCTHTGNEDHPWWTVDLGASNNICGVVITNRGDCCSKRLTNFDIFVTDRRPSSGFRPTTAELCRRMPAAFTFTDTDTFDCIGMISGRYVGVQIREQQTLTLCEVEIRTPA